MKNKQKNIFKYVCCPSCKRDLYKKSSFLICNNCGQKYGIVDKNILRIIPNLTKDLELSLQKWDEFYQRQLVNKDYKKSYRKYMDDFFPDMYDQLAEAKKIDKNLIYLEIGCGPFFMGQELAPKVKLVIGIDFCLTPLKIAKKMLEEKHIKNYLLIQGDILNMPLAANTVDLIYGGGVIEHFKNTQRCVNGLYRILKPEGVSFNAVPYLNIGSLTYRQIWGNIPNLPVLRQLAEFIHISLLRGKHMIFGYELSFLGSTLKKIHKRAGFKQIKIDKYKIKLAFDFIPFKILRKIFDFMANNNRLFWPMVKVIAQK